MTRPRAIARLSSWTNAKRRPTDRYQRRLPLRRIPSPPRIDNSCGSRRSRKPIDLPPAVARAFGSSIDFHRGVSSAVLRNRAFVYDLFPSPESNLHEAI